MKKIFKTILWGLLAFTLLAEANAWAQTTHPEAVAPGNKVYFQLVNDKDHPIPADEIEDVTRELVNAGEWVSVATPEEADLFKKANR